MPAGRQAGFLACRRALPDPLFSQVVAGPRRQRQAHSSLQACAAAWWNTWRPAGRAKQWQASHGCRRRGGQAAGGGHSRRRCTGAGGRRQHALRQHWCSLGA